MNINRFKVNLGVILASMMLASTAYSMQPSITQVDIGADKGKEITCEGTIYLAQDSPSCAGVPSGCSNILVDNCAPLQHAKAASCLTEKPDTAFMETYERMNLEDYVSVQSKVIEAMQQQEQFKGMDVQALVHSEAYKEQFTKKWNARPKVKITGILENCTACPNCYPPSECSVSHCKAEFVKPEIPPAAK